MLDAEAAAITGPDALHDLMSEVERAQPDRPAKRPKPDDTCTTSDPSFGGSAAAAGPSCATWVISHAQCTSHITHRMCPEQPARVQRVLERLRSLLLGGEPSAEGQSSRPGGVPPPRFRLLELTTSTEMLAALEAQLIKPTEAPAAASSSPLDTALMPPPDVAAGGSGKAARRSAVGVSLRRTASVCYLEARVLPAVRQVHSAVYLEKLRATCAAAAASEERRAARMATAHTKRKAPMPALIRNLSGITRDTYASHTSLAAALCAVLACCKGVDAIVQGEAVNAFCVVRPPGHHAGVHGTTVRGSTEAADLPLEESPKRRVGGRPRSAESPGAGSQGAGSQGAGSPKPAAAEAESPTAGAPSDGANGDGKPVPAGRARRSHHPPRRLEEEEEGKQLGKPKPPKPLPLKPPLQPPLQKQSSVGSTSDASTERASSPTPLIKDRCGQGFCLLNNVAIAAKYALLQHAAAVRRVAIIDWDLHHGNGTEEIVRSWGCDNVLYASLHGAEQFFYPETGTALQLDPTLVNVPLARGAAPSLAALPDRTRMLDTRPSCTAGTPPDEYLAAFDRYVVPAMCRCTMRSFPV